MAGLSIVFKAVDEISSRFDAMTNAGSRALDVMAEMETAADAALSAISDGAEEANQAMNQVAHATDYWTEKLGNYDKGAMLATHTIEELVEQGYMTEDALAAMAEAAAKAQEETEGLGKESDETKDKLGGLGEETEKTTKKTEGFGKKGVEAVESLNKVLAAAGIAVMLATIGNSFLDASHAAAQFETGLAQVSTIADTAVLSMDDISEEVQILSRDVAVAVTDLSEATYGAISASVDTANSVTFVRTANELAIGGFTRQATAVDVLTTAINAYGLEVSAASQISDYLVTTQNLGKTTVDQLASSMGMVIPTAAAFGVELDNLSTAYAILTANGVQTAQSTTYLKSMLSELASTGSEVSKVLVEETGQSFSQLMDNGYSLGDVMQILGDSVGGNTTAFMNLWGSMEAGSGAVSLYNSGAEKYASVLGKMQNSAGAATTAYEIMTDTTEFSSQRMENSFKNLSIAIGDDLNPAIRNAQNSIADITDRFTDVIKKYPAISAVMTGLTIGFGLVTTGVAAYTAATTLASNVTTAFGVTSMAALWPLAAVAASIAAIAAGAIYFTQKMEEATNVEEHLVSSSQKMADELDDLQVQYDEAVAMYGRNSDEAYELKHQIDELSQSFSENRRTIGELALEAEHLTQSIEETYQTYEDAITANGELEYSSMGLIQQLATLSEKSTHTDSELVLMQGIVDRLNGSYEGLNLTLDKTNGKLNLSIEDLYSAVSKATEESNHQAALDGLMDAMQTFDESKQKAEDAWAESALARANYDDLEAKWKADHPLKAAMAGSAAANWSKELTVANNEYRSLNDTAMQCSKAYEDNIEKIEEYCAMLGYTTEETQEFIESLKESKVSADDFKDSISDLSGQDAANAAIEGMQAQLTELGEEYDKAYQAAYDSIDGQIGLFEKMKTETELSIQDMQDAMESQVEYINRYTENIQKAQEYGLNEDLISKLSDGSAESAGQLDAIIKKVEELGGTTQDAQSFVNDFNSSFEGVSEAKESFADTVGQMESGFAAGMDAIKDDLDEAVEKMNLSEEAAAAAKATMDAYINAIKNKTGEVNSAFEAIKIGNAGGFKVDRFYATGTTNAAPGLAMVGEEGPELVNFSGGEVVYTADETANIISNANKGFGTIQDGKSESDFYVAPISSFGSEAKDSVVTEKEEKVVIVKLEGAGEIKVAGNMDKDAVLKLLWSNAKDVLMDIIRTEIMEEGEGAYEF